MKHIKLISSTLVIILSASLFAGCDFLFNSANAEDIYNKYSEIVQEYTVEESDSIVATSSLFNVNEKLYITYKDSNFSYEMSQRPDSVFNVFDEEYPQMLYSALSFFNKYKVSLTVSSNEWTSDNISSMYEALLDFESALNTFNTQKVAMENISIADYPYTATTLVQYNSFLSAYNNLLEKTIDFSKLFEKAYRQDIINADEFLTENEVPNYEVERLAYTSSVYMAEATYNYYVKHLGSFNNSDMLLYNSMYNIRQDLRNLAVNVGSTSGTNTELYRITRSHEKQMITQSDFYVNAIKQANGLEGANSNYDSNLYEDYVSTVNEVTSNYNNYASYVTELFNNIAA